MCRKSLYWALKQCHQYADIFNNILHALDKTLMLRVACPIRGAFCRSPSSSPSHAEFVWQRTALNHSKSFLVISQVDHISMSLMWCYLRNQIVWYWVNYCIEHLMGIIYWWCQQQLDAALYASSDAIHISLRSKTLYYWSAFSLKSNRLRAS